MSSAASKVGDKKGGPSSIKEAAAFNNPRKALETELGLETQYTYVGALAPRARALIANQGAEFCLTAISAPSAPAVPHADLCCVFAVVLVAHLAFRF